MKHVLLFLSLVTLAFAQNTPRGPVTKNTATNEITEDLKIGTGRTLSGNGTFNFGNGTVTIPASVTVGNRTLALTLSGNTSLTFPTSGTVSTLTGTETLTNKTLTAPILGNATATSITGPSATNLTLAGGSSGASLTLGSGTNGAATITLPGTGTLSVIGNGTQYQTIQSAASNYSYLRHGLDMSGSYSFIDSGKAGTGTTFPLDVFVGGARYGRWSTGGNLLIGGTTDITGSGGLKVFGTTAATSTTTGVLQVAGGVGVAGAGYFGSTVVGSSTGQFTGLGLGAAKDANAALTISTSLRALHVVDTNTSGRSWAFGPGIAATVSDFVLYDLTAGATIAKFSTGGNWTTPGNLTVSGGQIAFPAAQSASTNANTFDDYEEGTWTPSIGGTATYNVQEGFYVKVGQLVYCQAKLHINALGTGSATTISGLPFASFSATNSSQGNGRVHYFSNIATSVIVLTPVVANNGSTVAFSSQTASAATTSNITTTVFQDNARVDFTVVYRAAQ